MPQSLATDRQLGALRYLPTAREDQIRFLNLMMWLHFGGDGERDREGDLGRDRKMNILACFRVADDEHPRTGVDIVEPDPRPLARPTAGQEAEQMVATMHRAFESFPCLTPSRIGFEVERDLRGLILGELNRACRQCWRQ